MLRRTSHLSRHSSVSRKALVARVARRFTEQLEERLLFSVPEPNDTFSTAYTPPDNIYLEQNYAPTDSVNVNGDANDYFKFYNLYGASHLYAALDGLSADADLYVYDTNQNQIASSRMGGSNSETINVDLPGNQYFYVRVAAYSGATNYSLFLYNDYAGSSTSTARDIGTSWGQSSDKFWNYGPKIFWNDYLDYRDNVDYVKFTMEAAGNISLRQEAVNNDPGGLVDNMQLLDSSGSLLINAVSSDGGGFNLDRFYANAGTYYVKFTQITGSGPYTYRIVSDYAGDILPQPRPISDVPRDLGDITNSSREEYDMVGTGFTGLASYADSSDLYKFTLSKTAPLDLTLDVPSLFSQPTFEANLQLARDFNGDGTLESNEIIAQSNNPGSDAIHTTLVAGTYYVNVVPSATSAYTSYQLDFESDFDGVTGDPKGYANLTQAINAGPLSGESFYDAGFGTRPGGDISDFYKFQMTSAGKFQASAFLNNYYSRMTYTPSLAVIIDSNNNGHFDAGENITPFSTGVLNANLAAGSYYLEVGSSGGQSVYQLRLLSDYSGNSLSAAKPLAAISGAAPPTQTFKDYIEQDFGSNNDVNDFYSFALPGTYTTTLKTTGVAGEDLSLALIKDTNNNGVVDSGDVIASSNAADSPFESITKTLAAGKYFVRVMGLNGATNYTLTAGFSAGAITPFTPLRINAGGPAFTDSLQNVWQADAGFTGGAVSTSAYAVAGTGDDALYYDRRAGASFTFAKTVPSGQYTVKLLFADATSTNQGQRVFNVSAEGTKVISNLDLFLAAGAKKAYSKAFVVNVSDGTLNLGFQGVIGSATISGISILRSDIPTVHVNAGGATYTDTYGNSWKADSGFTGGTATVSGAAIAKTFDDSLFSSYRAGSSFTFAAAVANGSYQLRLLFEDPGATVAGQRKFNVTAEGTTILSNFDIVAAAGAGKTAVARSFTVNVTDGTLNLSFKGVVGNAVVSGIELIPV